MVGTSAGTWCFCLAPGEPGELGVCSQTPIAGEVGAGEAEAGEIGSGNLVTDSPRWILLHGAAAVPRSPRPDWARFN